MKNHVKGFNSFVNEVFGFYESGKPRKLRKHLVGGKGQKAQYDALDDLNRDYLEVQFELLGEKDPDLVKAFLASLSKYNSIGQVEAALGKYLYHAMHGEKEYEEPGWDVQSTSRAKGSTGED